MTTQAIPVVDSPVVREMTSEVIRTAGLWLRIFWVFFVLEQWNTLPGPTWCKVLQFVALQLIPGGFDEMIYMGILWAVRKVIKIVKSRRQS
jgi:hypothetical protein